MQSLNLYERAIKGLECCTKYPNEFGDCMGGDCPYGPRIECHKELLQDALALLKAQEPRVMTLEEVRGSLKQPIWEEVRSSHKNLYTGWVLAYDIQKGQGITGTRLGMAEPSGRMAWYGLEDYGTKWRCWDKRPTDEQREDTPWN